MIYKCLVVDDEPLSRELIESYISQIDSLECVRTCASAIEASVVLKETAIDLLFLDIEMPILKGTDFYRQLITKPSVIFTTAYRNYALDGFDVNATDYLLKPIVFDRFFSAIEKFLDKKNTPSTDVLNHIFISSNKKNIKLVLDDIVMVESDKDYIKVCQKEAQNTYKLNLSTLEKKLDDRFIRVHRSFIINTHFISAYTKKTIELGTYKIPIGDFYRKDVLQKISE